MAALDNASASVAGLAPLIARWPDLTMKLALLLQLVIAPRSVEISGETLAEALGLLVAVGGPGVCLLLGIEAAKAAGGLEGLEAEVEILVSKVRMKGPLTRRELCRSYHSQRSSILEPVLNAALEKGRIVDCDGKLMVL